MCIKLVYVLYVLCILDKRWFATVYWHSRMVHHVRKMLLKG